MRIVNKKVQHEYEVLRSFEVGIVLSGAEARGARIGKANISRSYARILNNELVLINASIGYLGSTEEERTRSRKLLAHRSEIAAIESTMRASKLALIPLAMYNRGNLIKLELGMVRARKSREKKQRVRNRDLKRDMERQIKNY